MTLAVLQVHPTRRCNLRCLHCYSSSGPSERTQLPLPALEHLVEDAADEGYQALSLSGGEPLLYQGLPVLLERAHRVGLGTTVTTNGTLLRKRYLDSIAEHVDLLAISLDGVPDSHNRMRASPDAFDLLHQGLGEVRRLGIPFGFIFTLTQHNVNELRWVADFARSVGARLLQIHPLELVGRARDELAGGVPDSVERFYAWIEALGLQAEAGEGLRVQLDLASVQALTTERHLALAASQEQDWSRRPLADLCAPLVLEPDGMLVPLTYGFPRHLSVGHIARERLPVAAQRWRRHFGDFLDHCQAAHQRAQREGGLVNWYELLMTDPGQPFALASAHGVG